ncbi:snoRNA-binding rRNA-processing protein, partial [Coemansia aciculifera]
MPKATSKPKTRHDPLHVELSSGAQIKTKGRAKYAEREQTRAKKESGEGYIDPKTSKRLLKIARDQQEEVGEEDEDDVNAQYQDQSSDEEEEDDDDETAPGRRIYNDEEDDSDDEGEMDYSEEEYEEEVLEGEAAAMFEKFMPSAPRERQNLADIIMAKIKQHEAAKANDGGAQAKGQGDDDEENGRRPVPRGLDPRIVQVYSKIGELLSRYKS